MKNRRDFQATLTALLLLFSGGCSGLLLHDEEPLAHSEEPSFEEDPLYNFKTRIDEGWELKIIDGELVFTRKESNGVVIYQPN